jgi:integrase
MVRLRQDERGNFSARKRLPDDVRDEYGQRYGARFEAKFSASAKVGSHAAKQMFREWDAEVTARIATIRAERNGEGIPLTPQQARALAGEWYDWFIARHPASDLTKWEALRDEVHDAMREAVGDAQWERSEPDDLWRQDKELRRNMRPVLADVGETAQFLALKGQVLNREAHDRFVDWLYEDLSAALRRLIRQAQGDYRDDGYAKRFPKFEVADAGETPQQLFDRWVSERKPAVSTVDTWRYFFSDMTAHFEGRSGGSISPNEAQAWIVGLIGKERSAATVRDNWLRASKTVFSWATDHKLVPRNPFTDVKVTVPKKVKLRETQAFLPDEWRTILRASLAVTNTETPDNATRRWVPWLCAYTGARAGEITQLRGSDVIERGGIPALRITPDAGAVKGGKARVVPLHEHLIKQGFLEFVHGRGAGPLFYNPPRQRDEGDRTRMKKPRSVQARQRLASWVRSLGVADAELSPNHGWRHSFKQIADRHGITPRMSDYITGHAPRSVGAGYGAPTLDDMAEALKKFPRYDV